MSHLPRLLFLRLSLLMHAYVSSVLLHESYQHDPEHSPSDTCAWLCAQLRLAVTLVWNAGGAGGW